MKKIIILCLCLFVFSLSIDNNTQWKKSKGIWYHIIQNTGKNDVTELSFTLPEKSQAFTAVAIGSGSGNFDVDIAVYNEDMELQATDTEPEPISAVTLAASVNTTYNLKITCTSGRGNVVVYAGDANKLMKILVRSAL